MSGGARTLSVHGEGQVAVRPDLATLLVGVEIADPDLARAQRDNTARMTAILAALKGAGIAERDLRTSGYAVHQAYRPPDPRRGATDDPPGYQVSNTVRATVRDLARLGETIDLAIAAGANRVHSITFDLEDKAGAIRQARAAAVADAREKAEQYAALTGMRLGTALAIVEGGDRGRPPHFEKEAVLTVQRSPSPTPIESGEGVMRLTVQILYEIAEAPARGDG